LSREEAEVQVNAHFPRTYLPIVRIGLILVAGIIVLGTGFAIGSIFGGGKDEFEPADYVATLMAMTPQVTPIAPTATPMATDTPTSTQEPTATATATTTATATFTPTATATPLPNDWVEFVDDVTIPDGTILNAGETFTKIWRLKNTGSRTWTVDYDLVFLSGDRMDSAAAVALPRTVKSGETVDVAVRLVAPEDPGDYRGYWILRNAYGGIFGVGTEANKPFWVDIEVEDADDIVYDLAEYYCDAEWTSDVGVLPCPGAAGDVEGIVAQHAAPLMEGGVEAPGPSLAVAPEQVSQGWITGSFPAFTVSSGDHFRASVACMYNSQKCYMQFRLEYQIGSGSVRSLGSWLEASEGLANRIDIDLSSLSGKEVTFFLSISAGEDWLGDNGLWIRPRIVQ
jgi:hypothetical protein